MRKYYFMSTNTGELARNIFSVIKITLENLRYYRFFTRWKFNRKGF